MARKIFVSYKYKDAGVHPIPGIAPFETTTARHYVDELIKHLDINDHIYKGEGNEDLSDFKDETIASSLKDRIFDSSITIILLSKNMKNPLESEDDQWIPWEVSYSLREKTRDGKTSKPNAMLAVVLPDENGSYEYVVKNSGCLHCGTRSWEVESLFKIIKENMFNKKEPEKGTCNTSCGNTYHKNPGHSYIHPVKWNEFISDINRHVGIAADINDNIYDYEVSKVI